jgi:hypothetical protein
MVMVRSDSVARSPKVHGRDCLFRLHTMLSLMLFILKTHLCLSLLYLQSTHSFTSTDRERRRDERRG